jgi:putative tryptophan/tyrosine transport system substrate-binding protein
VVARAQRSGRVRRIGVQMAFPSTDLEAKARVAKFKQELEKLRWIEGRNIQSEERWADLAAGLGLMQTYAAELVKLGMDVVLTNGPVGVTSVLRESRSLPIVFATVTDPVALGLVESLARPGGNVTGFALFENSVIPKFVELLREMVPKMARVALLHNPDNPSRILHLRALETIAASLSLIPITAPVRNGAEIEQAMEAVAHEGGGRADVSA